MFTGEQLRENAHKSQLSWPSKTCLKQAKRIDFRAVIPWKPLIVIAGILLILSVIAGLVGFEYWWRSSPEYSIRQIGVAVETHDLALFRKHVDIQAVTSRLIDDLMAQQGRNNTNALGSALVGLVKPQLTLYMTTQVERFVETGKFEAHENTNGGDTLRELHVELAGRSGSLISKRYEGSVVILQMEIEPRTERGRTTTIDLKMRRTDDSYWQLMEVSLPKPAKK